MPGTRNRIGLLGKCAAATALLSAAGGATLRAENIPLQPFTVRHEAAANSPLNVSFLLDAPAGKYGFLQVSNGHLSFAGGRRFRIWGVNLTGWTKGSTLLPPKQHAGLWADALARLGINCVRFHFLDRTTTQRPAGLIDGSRNDTLEFDPQAIDRLDYFIYELKRRGIYINLNLNVGRTYKPGDGVPDHDLIGVAKAMTYIGPRLLELQRDYARKLLTHFNPYTQLEYRNDPALAIVELVNENSVLEFWMRNWLRGELKPGAPRYMLDLTPYYEKILTQRYNEWLARTLTASELDALRRAAGVAAGEPVPRLRREHLAEAPKERFYREAEFYMQFEDEFFQGMRSFLKNELGVKSLIVGTADHTYFIPGQPQLRSTSRLDIVDAHVYWQHPAIYGRRNTPMVNEPLKASVVKLTRTAFLGKPFTVSEVNQPVPSEYAAEMAPILASYAAFQDWDGIFFYTFEPKIPGEYQPFLEDNFDITLDPVRVAQLPAGALLFLRGDVKPARQTIERSYSREEIYESIRLPDAERPYYTPGFPLSLPLRHATRVRCLECEPTSQFVDEGPAPYRSDTGELTWYADPAKGGLVTVDTERTAVLAGFVKTHEKAVRHLAAEVKNDHCVITLSSLDGKPISRSARLLLTAGSRYQNTGSRWNERRTLWEEWGAPPVLIEPVTGWVLLRDIDGAVGMRVKPLDGAGQPIGEPISGRRLEDGWEFPVGAPATTQYLIEMIR